MARENLVKNLGAAYVNDSFHGALFTLDGIISQFEMTNDTSTVLNQLNGKEWTRVTVPASKLKDFTTFAHPKLGYRELSIRKNHGVLNLSGLRTGRRGFRMDTVHADTFAVYQSLDAYITDDFADMEYGAKVKLIFEPQFSTLKLGIQELLDGRKLGVALNHDTAIVADVSADSEYPWSIYYRDVKVGGIEENGNIVVAQKTINRETLRKKLELV